MNLYQFVGTLTVYHRDSSDTVNSVKSSLGLDNLLLRGAKLKDTEFIYGTIAQFILLNEVVSLTVLSFFLN